MTSKNLFRPARLLLRQNRRERMTSITLSLPATHTLRPSRSFTAPVTSAFPGRIRALHSNGDPPGSGSDSKGSTGSPAKSISIRSTGSGWMMHPFLRDGRAVFYVANEYLDRAVIKVDLPGIGKGGLKLNAEGDNLVFEAVEEGGSDPEASAGAGGEVQPRRFFGVLQMPPGFYNTGEAKGFMQNGILKVVVPRSENTKGLPLPETDCTMSYYLS